MDSENIGLYLTLYSKPYYTRVIKIVKELELLTGFSIYIFGEFLESLIKQSYNSRYTQSDCVDLWFDTDKSVSSLKLVKINDICFNIKNNSMQIGELYIDTSGTFGTHGDASAHELTKSTLVSNLQ
jgi:hypothetical protein